MLNKITYSVKKFLLHFIQAHLMVTIISFPILIGWGMPISKVSIIGNLIFSPFLTIFLIISSLTFFTELLCIPNGFLISQLNQLTSFWEKGLHFGQKKWLCCFAKPSFIILISIPIITFIIISYKKTYASCI